MAVVYNGKHHRNPSGLHNKVKWILSESKWNMDKYKEIRKEICPLGCTIVFGNSPNPNHKGLRDFFWKASWQHAFAIAGYILTDSKLPSSVYYYPWLKEYFDENGNRK